MTKTVGPGRGEIRYNHILLFRRLIGMHSSTHAYIDTTMTDTLRFGLRGTS